MDAPSAVPPVRPPAWAWNARRCNRRCRSSASPASL